MSGTVDRLLLFELPPYTYGLALSRIAEVMDLPVVYPIPRGPACFIGAMNFHGRVVPVLDLARLVGIGSFAPGGKVVVIAPDLATLALGVGPAVTIESSEEILEEVAGSSPMVERVLVAADREIRLLSVDGLLAAVEEHFHA